MVRLLFEQLIGAMGGVFGGGLVANGRDGAGDDATANGDEL
jgi:hypothetical protein